MHEAFTRIGANVFRLAGPSFNEMYNFFEGDFPLKFLMQQAKNR
jgi:hypothetical protein